MIRPNGRMRAANSMIDMITSSGPRSLYRLDRRSFRHDTHDRDREPKRGEQAGKQPRRSPGAERKTALTGQFRGGDKGEYRH